MGSETAHLKHKRQESPELQESGSVVSSKSKKAKKFRPPISSLQFAASNEIEVQPSANTLFKAQDEVIDFGENVWEDDNLSRGWGGSELSS
jgi:hypothetical protein